jgi:hypothetical protein
MENKTDIEKICKNLNTKASGWIPMNLFSEALNRSPSVMQAYQISSEDLNTEHWKTFCAHHLDTMLRTWPMEKQYPGADVDDIQEALMS